jgi:DUF2934 family protein
MPAVQCSPRTGTTEALSERSLRTRIRKELRHVDKTQRGELGRVRDEDFEIVEAIQKRAYELYEQRNKEDGHDVEDWFQAEKEVRAKKHRAAAA